MDVMDVVVRDCLRCPTYRKEWYQSMRRRELAAIGKSVLRYARRRARKQRQRRYGVSRHLWHRNHDHLQGAP